MEEQPYRRVMKGKKTTYEPVNYYEPLVSEDDGPDKDFKVSDRQVLTIAGALATMVLMIFQRNYPDHALAARQMKKLEEAILLTFRSTGEQVDTRLIEWVRKCWDDTMRRAENMPAELKGRVMKGMNA